MLVTRPVLAAVGTAVRDIAPALATVVVAGAPTDGDVLGYEDLVAEDGDPAPRSTSPTTARR